MPYKDWTPKHKHLKRDDFCELRVLLLFLRSLRRSQIRFATYANLAEDIECFLGARQIVSKNVRFPENAIYVNISNGVISKNIEKIVDYLEMVKYTLDDKEEVRTFGRVKFKLQNKILESVLLTSDSMKLLRTYRGYTRETFEKHFNLTWSNR